MNSFNADVPKKQKFEAFSELYDWKQTSQIGLFFKMLLLKKKETKNQWKLKYDKIFNF